MILLIQFYYIFIIQSIIQKYWENGLWGYELGWIITECITACKLHVTLHWCVMIRIIVKDVHVRNAEEECCLGFRILSWKVLPTDYPGLPCSPHFPYLAFLCSYYWIWGYRINLTVNMTDVIFSRTKHVLKNQLLQSRYESYRTTHRSHSTAVGHESWLTTQLTNHLGNLLVFHYQDHLGKMNSQSVIIWKLNNHSDTFSHRSTQCEISIFANIYLLEQLIFITTM